MRTNKLLILIAGFLPWVGFGLVLTYWNDRSVTRLEAALYEQDFAAAKKLIEGGQVEARGRLGTHTPLQDAISLANRNGRHAQEWIDVVRLLVDAHVDVNEPGSFCATPLHTAAQGRDRVIVDFLLKHGAIVDRRDCRGYTPLMMAARAGNVAAVGSLLDAGADPGLVARDGKSAAQLAKTLEIDELVSAAVHK